MSDVGLAKVCRRAGIPTPPRGYWAKVRQGRKVQREPLSGTADGAEVILKVQLGEPSPRPPKTVATLPEVPLQTQIEELHPLVKRTAARFARYSVDRNEVIALRDPQLLQARCSSD
jgi:hypothetical protein